MPTFPKKISGPQVVKPSTLGPSLTTTKFTSSPQNTPSNRASSFSK